MRDALNASQQDLTARFLRMLSISLEQVALIRTAILHSHYTGLSVRTHELEQELDTLEREVEETCLNAIARYQPLAFRQVSSTSRSSVSSSCSSSCVRTEIGRAHV